MLALQLEPAPWVSVDWSGTVLTPDGSPQPGARVALETLAPGERRVSGSDEEGVFRFTAVREGAYRLVVDAHGQALARRELLVKEGMAPVEVRLEPGSSLEGSIRGLDVDQLRRLRVELQAAGYYGRPLLAEMSGDRYRIDDLGSGEWFLIAGLADTRLEEKVVVEAAGSRLHRDLVFPRLHLVRCRVTLERRPVEQSSLHLNEAGGGNSYVAQREGDGVFVFPEVPAGDYQLSYFGAGGGTQRSLAVRSDLDIHVDLRAALVEGRVVDAESGQGISGVEVEAAGTIMVSHSPWGFRARSGAGGWFRLGPLVEGPWRFFARREREVLASEGLNVTRDGTNRVTLRVSSVGGLRFRVETEGGGLPRVVKLLLRNEAGDSAHGAPSVGASGEGWWREAPDGRWRLRAADGFGWITTEVTIPGEPAVLRFPLSGALRVHVPVLQLETDVGAEIRARFEGESRPGRRTIMKGRLIGAMRGFHLTGLRPGLWSVEVMTDDDRVWTDVVEVRANTFNEFVLQP